MAKFFCFIAILAGAFLLAFQWGTVERSFATARLLVELVEVYGVAYGKTLSWAYLLLPAIGVNVGMLGIVAECRKDYARSH